MSDGRDKKITGTKRKVAEDGSSSGSSSAAAGDDAPSQIPIQTAPPGPSVVVSDSALPLDTVELALPGSGSDQPPPPLVADPFADNKHKSSSSTPSAPKSFPAPAEVPPLSEEDLKMFSASASFSGRSGDRKTEIPSLDSAHDVVKRFVQRFKIKSAYEVLAQAPKALGKIKFRDKSKILGIQARSKLNIEKITTELKAGASGAKNPYGLRDDELDLFRTLLGLPYSLQHATNAFPVIQASGRLISTTEVQRSKADFDPVFSTPGNRNHLGNAGFVFFRGFVDPVNETVTRYGGTSLFFPLDVLCQYGWISLHDQLKPFPTEGSKKFTWSNGSVLRAAETFQNPSDYAKKGPGHTGLRYTYARVEGDPLVVERHFLDEVFYGPDIRLGLALSFIREIRNIDPSYRAEILRRFNEIYRKLLATETPTVPASGSLSSALSSSSSSSAQPEESKRQSQRDILSRELHVFLGGIFKDLFRFEGKYPAGLELSLSHVGSRVVPTYVPFGSSSSVPREFEVKNRDGDGRVNLDLSENPIDTQLSQYRDGARVLDARLHVVRQQKALLEKRTVAISAALNAEMAPIVLRQTALMARVNAAFNPDPSKPAMSPTVFQQEVAAIYAEQQSLMAVTQAMGERLGTIQENVNKLAEYSAEIQRINDFLERARVAREYEEKERSSFSATLSELEVSAEQKDLKAEAEGLIGATPLKKRERPIPGKMVDAQPEDEDKDDSEYVPSDEENSEGEDDELEMLVDKIGIEKLKVLQTFYQPLLETGQVEFDYLVEIPLQRLRLIAMTPLYLSIVKDPSSKNIQLLKLLLEVDQASVPQKPKPVEGQEWYTSDQVYRLLTNELKDSPTRVAYPISEHQPGAIQGNLYEQLLQSIILNSFLGVGGRPPNSIIPINLGPLETGGMHWVFLHVRYPTDDLMAPNIRYVDPLGREMPANLGEAVLRVYHRANFIPSRTVYQEDGNNCGPWVVALGSHLERTGDLPAKERINISEARRNHQAYLAPAVGSGDTKSHSSSSRQRHQSSLRRLSETAVGQSFPLRLAGRSSPARDQKSSVTPSAQTVVVPQSDSARASSSSSSGFGGGPKRGPNSTGSNK